MPDTPAYSFGTVQVQGPTSSPTVNGSVLLNNIDGTSYGWTPQIDINRRGGWSVMGDRPGHPKAAYATTTGVSARMGLVPNATYLKTVAAYSTNWPNASSDNPATNYINVRTSIEPLNLALNAGSAANQMVGNGKEYYLYNGKRDGVIVPNTLLLSDPLCHTPLIAGTRSWINTWSQAPTYPTPSAPSLSATAGAGLSNGTYTVGITIVYSDNVEGPCTSANIALSGGNNQITVTDPGASNYPSAIGFKLWMAAVGVTTPLFSCGRGVIPFGASTILSAGPSSTQQQTMERRIPGAALGSVNGMSPLGSTIGGGNGTGEFVSTTTDYTQDGYTRGGNTGTGSLSYSFMLGFDPTQVHKSYALLTDSIGVGVAEYGFGNTTFGGFAVRPMLNQTTNVYYDVTVAPLYGYIPLGCAGESASQFSSTLGNHRRKLAMYCTHFLYTYGTNDLSGGTHVLDLANYLKLGISPLIASGMFGVVTAITPDTLSTDGGVALSNQSWPRSGVSIDKEPNRRLWNNWNRAGNAAVSRTDESMCGAYTGTQAYNANWYRGGDGTATKFFSGGLPFVPGTEIVKVAGVTKTLTTDYTYYGQTTVNGVSYACGVVFTVAPTNGATVTLSYTSAPGLYAAIGYPIQLRFSDTTSLVEVDSTGTLISNGGLWLQSGSSLFSGTSTGSNTSSTYNTLLTFTQDQVRNKSVRIQTDSVTPAAIGQYGVITGNANGASSILNTTTWTTIPSGSSTYIIYDPVCSSEPTGGLLHPASRGHMLMSQVLLLSL